MITFLPQIIFCSLCLSDGWLLRDASTNFWILRYLIKCIKKVVVKRQEGGTIVVDVMANVHSYKKYEIVYIIMSKIALEMWVMI